MPNRNSLSLTHPIAMNQLYLPFISIETVSDSKINSTNLKIKSPKHEAYIHTILWTEYSADILHLVGNC